MVRGLVINNDDLIHADKHGVVPHETAKEVPMACEKVEDRERRIIKFCRLPDSDAEALQSGKF